MVRTKRTKPDPVYCCPKCKRFDTLIAYMSVGLTIQADGSLAVSTNVECKIHPGTVVACNEAKGGCGHLNYSGEFRVKKEA